MADRIVGLFYKPDKDRSFDIANRIQSADYGDVDVVFLTDEAGRYRDGVASPERRADFRKMEFAISIGGDGTFLLTARALRDLGIPLYGINAGRLGFLASGNPENAVEDVRRILAGEYRLYSRVPLQGELYRGGVPIRELYALNEIAVTKGPLSRPIDLSVFAGGESLYRFLADGIIVSTPTGSTAYSLSAGGPVVHPDVSCVIVVPICPHSLYPRPVVLGASEVIDITLSGDSSEIVLSGDGHFNVELAPGDDVRLTLDTQRCVDVIKLDYASYYRVLQNKLNWGQGNAVSEDFYMPGICETHD